MKLWTDFLQLACFISAVSSNVIHGWVRNYEKYAESDPSTEIYVHTKEQPLGVELRLDKKSPYVREGVDTKIISHGYKGNRRQIQPIVNEYLKLENLNVLTYNWEALAGLSEVNAAVAAVSMGKYLVAATVKTLISAYGIKPEQIHLIGYNMGAHLLAAAGREQEKKIARVTGLDPHRKYFDNSSFIQLPGLNKDDATFVDVIHTSGGTLGLGTSIGTADIYPNGGDKQPKCKNDTSVDCNSLLVIDYFTESIKRPHAFWVRKCPNYKDFLDGKCKHNEIATAGAFEETTIQGNFYCKTNYKPPYGLEKGGLDLDFIQEVPNLGMENDENAMTQTPMSDIIKGGKFTTSPSTEYDLSFDIEYDYSTNKTDPIFASAEGVVAQGESFTTQTSKPVSASTEKNKPVLGFIYRPTVTVSSLTEDPKEYDLSLDIEYDEIINKTEIGSTTTVAEPNKNNTTLGSYHHNDTKPVEIALSFAGKPTGQTETLVTTTDISYEDDAKTTTTTTTNIPYSTLMALIQNTNPDANIDGVIKTTIPSLISMGKFPILGSQYEAQDHHSGVETTESVLFSTEKNTEESTSFTNTDNDVRTTEPTLIPIQMEQGHNLIGLGVDSGIYEDTRSTEPILSTTDNLMEQSHHFITVSIKPNEGRIITEPTFIPTKQTTNPTTADLYQETQTNNPFSTKPPTELSFDVHSEDVFDETDLASSSLDDGMFYVHTKKHPAGVGIVFYDLSRHLKKGRDTKIITHGYKGTPRDIQPIVDEYLKLGNVNVLSFDWSIAAKQNEFLAAVNAISLGANIVSIKIIVLRLVYNIKPEQIHLIGYGMGAHLMGAVGREHGHKLWRITGLDPHRKYFDHSSFVRLSGLKKTDAKFVDVIHTSGGTLGLATSIGTVDVYPNGGKKQPQCKNISSHFCDSLLAIDYFSESIKKPHAFWARKCPNYKDFLDGECKNTETVTWGAFGNTTINGNFYCSTNAMSPYGSGMNGAVPLTGHVVLEESPATETTDPMPSFIKNGTFYFHTRDHPEGVKVDFQSIPPYLKKAQDTKILTHGYNKNKDQLQPLVNEYIRKGNVNVITFDWSSTAKLGELQAALGAVGLGTTSVSHEMTPLMTSLKIKPEQIHLIGYEAGAHLMGAAGRNAKEKIGRITGLDPPENYFNNSSQVRFPGLSKTDAPFVDVIHTDGKKPGVDAHIESIELYPIGVRVGVSCKNNNPRFCQTPLVKDYLIESTFKPLVFWMPTCPDFKSFLSGKCNNNTTTGGIDAETTGDNSLLKSRQEKMVSGVFGVTAPPIKPTQPHPYPTKTFTENGLNFNMEYDDITNKIDLSQQLEMINHDVTTRHVPLYTKKFTQGGLNFDMEYDEITRKNPLARDKAYDIEKTTEPIQTWVKRPTKQTNSVKISGTNLKDVPKTKGQIPSSETNGTFYFHTKKHPKGIKIDFQNFPADLRNGKDTKIITHGYKENKDQLQPIINEFLKKGTMNVITFDWSPAANADELNAAKSAVFLGTSSVPDKIEELKSLLNIKSQQIHLIGHNMGAHLMGVAGRKMKDKVAVITGLDPHKKYFDNASHINLPGLSKNDAPLVDVIHTNKKEPGVDNTISSIDLYPTGAKIRPKCKNDHLSSCSVPVVMNYFAESILRPDSSWHHECHDFKAFFKGKCKHKHSGALGSGHVETPHNKDPVKPNVTLNGVTTERAQDGTFDGDRHKDTTTTKQLSPSIENGTFHFYTNEHPEGIKFDFTNIPRFLRDGTLTKILTHGYKGNKHQLQPIINEYLKKEHLNLITFDWSPAANLEELEAAKKAISLGTNTVSDKVHVLNSLLKISPDQIHLIGHGMGAHLMGAVGRKQHEKLGRITGLDPHKKYFDDSLPTKLPRLRKSDAEYVDVFHTSGGTLGIEEKIGTFDLYPNIPRIQKKCIKNNSSICYSLLAIEYFAEFVKDHEVFEDVECSHEEGKCVNKSTSFTTGKMANEDHHGTEDEHSEESGANATNSRPNKKSKAKKIKKTQTIKTSEVNGPKFYIHTKDHQEGIEFNFKKPSPYFKRNKDVKIITHGYNGSKDDMQIIVNEYLKGENVNVITLDWRHIANMKELKAAAGAVSIGNNILPAMIRISSLLHGMRPERTHLIGYNLGAHLMGATGREQGGTIKRITGLDPAKKFFDNSSHPQLPRLTKTDGKFVDVFHTSAGTLGIDESIGNVDVYPNGGHSQEPCKANNSSSCNSLLSIKYFAESINSPDAFWVINCSSFDDFVHGACVNGSKGTLNDLGRTLTNGNYYFVTNSEPPYGLGLVGLHVTEKLTPYESVNVTVSKPPLSLTQQSLQRTSKPHAQTLYNIHSPPFHNLKLKTLYHVNPQSFFFRSQKH